MHIHQVFQQPQLNLNVDRVKAGQLGLTQRDVTSSMLISLSGNNQVAPSFWLNPANGVSYNVGVQTSQYRIDSLDELLRTPVTAAIEHASRDDAGIARRRVRGRQRIRRLVAERRVAGVRQSRSDASESTQLLSNLVDVRRSYGPVIINHYNVAPVFDVYSNVDRRDLGSVGKEVEKIMKEEAAAPAARHDAHAARRVRDDADVVRPARPRNGLRRGAGVSADGGELPVLARSVHHSDGAAGRDGRDPLDAVRHRHDVERAVADGVDHVRSASRRPTAFCW